MPLPWIHFSPVSMTLHFELSIMMGTRQCRAPRRYSSKKVAIACSESRWLRPCWIRYLRTAFDLLLGDAQSFFELAAQNQLGELGRAGDVGALADVNEVGFRANHQRLQAAEAGESFDGGGTRGGKSLTASRMARMWAGVEPQQPPTMFTQPFAANSRRSADMISGVSSNPPKALGKPALG